MLLWPALLASLVIGDDDGAAKSRKKRIDDVNEDYDEKESGRISGLWFIEIFQLFSKFFGFIFLKKYPLKRRPNTNMRKFTKRRTLRR